MHQLRKKLLYCNKNDNYNCHKNCNGIINVAIFHRIYIEKKGCFGNKYSNFFNVHSILPYSILQKD